MSETSNTLHVTLNNEVVLAFDRNKPIPLKQLEYLDNMDLRLDAGIHINGEEITPTTQLQKAQYVANTMVNSLLKDDFNLAIAMCTYLGNRMKNLKQVVCVDNIEGKGIKIEFKFDKNLEQQQQEQTIQFFDPKDFQKH